MDPDHNLIDVFQRFGYLIKLRLDPATCTYCFLPCFVSSVAYYIILCVLYYAYYAIYIMYYDHN